MVDPTGKMPGRGAYLHNSRLCWEAGIKSSLGQSLKVKLSPEDIDSLNGYIASLEEDLEGNRKTDG